MAILQINPTTQRVNELQICAYDKEVCIDSTTFGLRSQARARIRWIAIKSFQANGNVDQKLARNEQSTRKQRLVGD
jgi:hypothetical protein